MKLEIEVPESAFSALRLAPNELSASLRFMAAVKLYEIGHLSQERAAELAGQPRQDFLISLSRLAVSPFQGVEEDQITRAGLSIASNIAEGMERQTKADKVKFLDYARGSSGELRTQLIVGAQAGLLKEEIANQFIEESRQLSAMIQGLIRSIRS